MYVRFVRLKVDEEKLWQARQFYEERVLPQLEETEGCLFACLLHGNIHGDEILSMTVWENPESAVEYERSGLFDRLLDESDELLQEPGEPTLDSPGQQPKVVFSGIEPEVESGIIAGSPDEEVLERAGSTRAFLRMVAIRLRPGAFEEFERRYEAEVRPTLAEMPGCLDAFLVAGSGDPGRALSVTLWEREEDAVRYGLSGQFERLTERLKDTFSDLYQWNLAVSKDGAPASAAGRRSPDVYGYHLIIGRKLR